MNWSSSFLTTLSIVAWCLDGDLCIKIEDTYMFFDELKLFSKMFPNIYLFHFDRNLKIGFNSQKIPQWQCITLHCLILDFRVPFLSMDFILECLCYSNYACSFSGAHQLRMDLVSVHFWTYLSRCRRSNNGLKCSKFF